jgi:hypothetical protein
MGIFGLDFFDATFLETTATAEKKHPQQDDHYYS